jgi:hypothetical protein
MNPRELKEYEKQERKFLRKLQDHGHETHRRIWLHRQSYLVVWTVKRKAWEPKPTGDSVLRISR